MGVRVFSFIAVSVSNPKNDRFIISTYSNKSSACRSMVYIDFEIAISLLTMESLEVLVYVRLLIAWLSHICFVWDVLVC